ncbi:MAG: DUF4390 domain-containing protein [Burkholderiales bacterium]|nr:DUF4390 domain-containing protein [Burkholderiales bacterium]
MASTTHCSRSASPPWRLALAALLVAITAFAFAPRAAAEGINIVRANVVSGADGYRLDAEFDIQFSPRLEEAVNRGVALNFVVEFELSKPRWYWFDEKPVQLSQTYKITYTPLLRQYRLSSGAAYQNFTRFEEVVGALSRVRGWPVAESGALRRQGEYQAAIRMRLDTTQLPKPFQLNAVASNDWNLASDWYRWTVNP